eukprot:gene19616-biopygen980
MWRGRRRPKEKNREWQRRRRCQVYKQHLDTHNTVLCSIALWLNGCREPHVLPSQLYPVVPIQPNPVHRHSTQLNPMQFNAIQSTTQPSKIQPNPTNAQRGAARRAALRNAAAQLRAARCGTPPPPPATRRRTPPTAVL